MTVNDILKDKNLEAVVIQSPENLFYHSGFTGGEGVLVLTKETKTLIVDGRYTVQAKQQANGADVVEYKGSPFAAVRDMRFDKIGFEDKKIPYNSFKEMNRAMPAVTMIGVSDSLDEIRTKKGEDEIKSIKTAVKIADMAFEHILKFIKPGITEREIALEIEFFMRKNGALGTSFPTIAACAERTALPHAEPTDAPVSEGDFVLMDFGCVYNGYCSDMTRTVAVGHADDKMKNIYDTVLKAQTSAIYAIKPGLACKESDAVARRVIENAGFGSCFGHSLGHGVGLEIHELPNLSPKSCHTLCPGNTVTVEPGIYIENFGGVRIEDLLLVTDCGNEILTKSPKDLIIL